MADSLIIDWLNENQYRAYPLKNKGTRTFGSGLSLDNMILDAALFSDNINTIPRLTGITLSGLGNIHCTITTNLGFSFLISNFQSASYPVYIRESLFGGLLVVGESIKSVTASATFTDVEFEESVLTFIDTYWYGVFSLNFNGANVSSGVIFEPGYQFKITADEATSTITLAAHMNYGIPIGCDEFFPGVDKDCDDIISYINGVTVTNDGSDMKFNAGPNIAIYNDPENHRIYVGLNFDTPDVCVNALDRPQPNVQ